MAVRTGVQLPLGEVARDCYLTSIDDVLYPVPVLPVLPQALDDDTDLWAVRVPVEVSVNVYRRHQSQGVRVVVALPLRVREVSPDPVRGLVPVRIEGVHLSSQH